MPALQHGERVTEANCHLLGLGDIIKVNAAGKQVGLLLLTHKVKCSETWVCTWLTSGVYERQVCFANFGRDDYTYTDWYYGRAICLRNKFIVTIEQIVYSVVLPDGDPYSYPIITEIQTC